MRLLKIIAFAAALSCIGGKANAGPAAAKLSGLTDSLVKGYLQKPEAVKATLAVFPFNCEKKLEERRVGFAVPELMSHRFVADGTFSVVERGELGKLLAEQRLQASGAVDNDTAVRLGQLAGAGVLLLGNIHKVDGKYQVNARLVDVRTSAVLVSGYEEFAIEAFEDDARPYLNLVPNEQALGLYFLYNTRYNSNRLPARTLSSFSGTETFVPDSFSLGMIGVGIRYAPKEKLMADVSYMRTAGPVAAANSSWSFVGKLDVEALRARMEYQLKKTLRLAYYAGAGVVLYTLHIDGKTMYYAPSVSFRLEYRPQSRIGLSVSANYDLTGEPAMSWGTVKSAELNKFHIEPVLTVYF